jgi:SAM-dependent methyltransferase
LQPEARFASGRRTTKRFLVTPGNLAYGARNFSGNRMRESLLDALACPDCQGDFTVVDARGSGGHIDEGALLCRGCGRRYPIEHSVPTFVPAEDRGDVVQTTRGFARNWDEYNYVILDNEKLNDELFRDWIAPLDPASMRGKLVLEPGCGMGRWLRVAAAYAPRMLIGVDYSTVAYTAGRNVRDLPNVHVIRADILRMPLKPVFQIGYCLGVVHHTPEPERTFNAVVEALAPDGVLTVWVYGAESNGWIRRFVTPLRTHVTSKLPHRVLLILSMLLTVPLYLAAGLASVLPLPYRRYLLHLRRYPFRYMSHIVYDHLVPEIAHYLPRAELERWGAQQGLRAELSERNGNSWRLLVSRVGETAAGQLPKTG